MGYAPMSIDAFDDWADLARRDPEGFEDRRRAVIDTFIANAPERNRTHLRRLQWRIDMERRRASNPVSACYRIYSMMWDSFAGDRGLMAALRNAQELVSEGHAEAPPRAQVLNFPAAAQVRGGH